MKKVIKFQKRISETPLDALYRFKSENPLYAEEKLSYAGRLDPQATGEMIILVGDECLNQEKYQNKYKIYTFDIIVGIETDTGDIMGLIESFDNSMKDQLQEEFSKIVQTFVGEYDQKYPNYSAIRVDGKPLWKWAKEGKINEIEVPSHTINIRDLKINNYSNIKPDDLLNDINDRVGKTKGNFRQDEIMNNWKRHLDKEELRGISIVSVTAEVSGGTYIRQLVKDFGTKLNRPLCCWHIHRDKVLLD